MNGILVSVFRWIHLSPIIALAAVMKSGANGVKVTHLPSTLSAQTQPFRSTYQFSRAIMSLANSVDTRSLSLLANDPCTFLGKRVALTFRPSTNCSKSSGLSKFRTSLRKRQSCLYLFSSGNGISTFMRIRSTSSPVSFDRPVKMLLVLSLLNPSCLPTSCSCMCFASA